MDEERDLLSASELPPEIRHCIEAVLGASGLRGSARREVLEELVAVLVHGSWV